MSVDSSLPMALFVPVLVLGLAWGVLTVSARVAGGRDGGAALASNLADIGFVALLAATGWSAVMLVAALVGYPTRIFTLAVILLIVFVFFGALVSALMVLFQTHLRGRPLGVWLAIVAVVGLLVFIAVSIVL